MDAPKLNHTYLGLGFPIFRKAANYQVHWENPEIIKGSFKVEGVVQHGYLDKNRGSKPINAWVLNNGEGQEWLVPFEPELAIDNSDPE